MTERISRRRALGAFGTVSLGALLGACGDDDRDRRITTTDGGSATVEPKTSPAASSLAEKLDAAGSCAQTAEQTEGPYDFDADAIRSDIREGRDGTVLTLALRVREADGCTPIENAIGDIWHCDAGGVYSGFDVARSS